MSREARLELPPLLDLDPSRHSEDAMIEMAYLRFRHELVGRGLTLRGTPVNVSDKGEPMEVNTTFWHISTEDQGVLGRHFLPERAKYIPYIRPLVEAGDTGLAPAWRNTRATARGPATNLVVATPDFDYHVVLRVTGGGRGLLLWTAYAVLSTHGARRLRREHSEQPI